MEKCYLMAESDPQTYDMDPDMDSKHRLGHFDTVVSPITSTITYHHGNLATGYYWPVLFADVCTFVRAYDQCQKYENKK